MKGITMSRRKLLQAGGCALAGTGLLHAATTPAGGKPVGAAGKTPSKTKAEMIRTYYSGWEKKDWSTLDILLDDGFTFTSPNNDDHISKSAFKTRCWPQKDWIERFELESVITKDDEAFVKYLGRTKNGKSFRNIDYFRFSNEKIGTIECYFGSDLGFPSAASTGHR